MRDFIHDLRCADRAVIDAQRDEDAALRRYQQMQSDTTEGLTHVADEAMRLQLLNEARQAYAHARNRTNSALDERARVIDDRIQDFIVGLIREGAIHPASLLAGVTQ